MENKGVRKEEVSRVTGIGEDRITEVRLDMGKLLEEGLLVDADLHGFSCLRAGVSFEELGIAGKDKRRERITAGTKRLAPPKYVRKMTSLEVRLRQCLDKYSFDVQGFKPWRWMPFTAYQEWQADTARIVAELRALIAEIIENYDAIQDENRQYFSQIARRAWQAYQLPYDGEAVVVAGGRAFEDYQVFEDYIVDNALAKMPTIEFLQSDVYFDYKTGYLFTSPEVVTAMARQDQAQAEASKAEAEARLAWQDEREKDLELTEKQLRQRTIADAVREAEREHILDQVQKTISPLDEVMQQFRARIYESVVKAAKSIENNSHLRGRTATALTGLASLYKTLTSATNDHELETALDALRAAVEKAPAEANGSHDIAAVEAALEAVTQITETEADKVHRVSLQTSVAGFLELDEPED